jgi:hypothetical protein
MDSFASPSIRGDRPIYRRVRLLEAAVLTLVLALSFVGVPGMPDARLDGSWQEMLMVARSRGLQFGQDIIFTWGPWGFLCSGYHMGGLEAVPVILWQTVGQVLIALGLVVLTNSLPLWRRLLFVAVTLAVHWLFLDSIYFVLITLVAIAGLMRRDAPVSQLVLWTVALGFLSQLKFTYLVISSAAVACSVACSLMRRLPSRAAAIAAGFAGSVLFWWVAAGQNPANLCSYLRRSLEISSGYGDAMGFDETWLVFLWGAGVVAALGLLAWRTWRDCPEGAFGRPASVFLAFTVFVMWKESYTRADMVPLGGHIFGIFTFALILAPVLPGLLFPGRVWHLFDAVVPACFVGIACMDVDYFRLAPRIAWERIYGNVRFLKHLGSMPGEWRGQYLTACDAVELPQVRAAVGTGTADVYDFNTGVALLNGLALSPRPVFQGYSAYTPLLQAYNLRHYQSGEAPEFLLWSRETVDNRYPGQDDAPLVAGMPGHYEPLFLEKGYWLFRRESPLSKNPLERRLVLSRSVKLNEEVDLPSPLAHALWLEADAVPTGLGRLRALLYKPATLNLGTTDDRGRQSSWRVLPRVARGGFILVPTLADGADLVALMHGEARSWVASLHFGTPPGQEEFWSHVELRAYELPSLPIRPAIPIARLVELGIFDRPAIDVTSTADQEVIEIPEGRALLLHAEGKAEFEVPRGASHVSFGYGLREGSYSGVGHTEGVQFSVEGIWTSGRRERLWSQYLDPVGRDGDRGTHHAELALPPDGPSRIILHIEPGPRRDFRWDWSYISAVRFAVTGDR